MGLFTKRNDTLYDYLDKEVDKAEIKAICANDINDIKFMRLAIHIVSSYIASAISTCEFKVYDKDGIVKDTTYYKLNFAPNPNDTATRLKYNMVKKLIQDGESLVVQHNNNLYFAESFGFESESINGYKFNNVVVQKTTLNKKFDRKTSFYFRLDDEKIKSFLSDIDEKYKSLVSCASKAYKKALNNKWKLKIDSAKQHDPKFQEEFETYVKEQLKDFLESDSAVYPELNGYQLEHLDDGTADKTDSSDIRNIRKDIFDMVAQAFKMPPSMMYGNISNLKEVVNQFIAFAVKPFATLIGEEITRNFFTENEILKKNKRVIVDISSINYRDIFDVATGLDKLISDGVANIDEVRPLVNLPVLGTDFSQQYWMTKNYSKIEDMMKEQEPTKKDSIVKNDNSNLDNNNNDNSNENVDNNVEQGELKGGDIDEEEQ